MTVRSNSMAISRHQSESISKPNTKNSIRRKLSEVREKDLEILKKEKEDRKKKAEELRKKQD
jgi:uncharacterized membrane protein